MLRRVIGNYGSLATMRVLSRLLHFVIKTYLIRTQLDRLILAHLLNLDLLFSLSLHVLKSCFKPSYQKVQNRQYDIQSSMNIMSFGILATIIKYWHFSHSGQNLLFFAQAIGLYAASSVLESIGEKYMVECTLRYKYLTIGAVEVASIVPKTLFIAYAAFNNLFSIYGILVFGISQLIYSFSFMVIFFILSPNKALGLQPLNIQGENRLFDRKSKESLKQFSMMSLLKLLLQQFEKIVLIVMGVSQTSAVYSLISNLGSVIVRYVFSPLNEIVFNHFSRGEYKESIKAFTSLIRFIMLLSIVIISFGHNYSRAFLSFLYGNKWVNQESIFCLRVYMFLVAFLGFNGIIQSFLLARGQESIKKYNYFSAITTTAHLCSTVVFLQAGLGAAGIFFGNIVNMGSRITLCWFLQIRKHFSLRQLTFEIMPSLSYSIVSAFIYYLSKQFIVILNISDILKLLIGTSLLGLNMIPLFIQNKQIVLQWINKIRGNNVKKNKNE